MKELKNKSSSVLIAFIQLNIQSLVNINLNKGTLISKVSFSKLSLKNQAITLLSELPANLVEIANKVKIVKNPFKQTIKENSDTRTACSFTFTFKYKLSVCNQFFKMLIFLNNYSKFIRENVENEQMNERNNESEIKNKKNKEQHAEK